MQESIKVTGIKEVATGLKGVSKDASKELRKGMKDIADDVARRASSEVPARTGKAASSIKPRGTVKGAAIAYGSPAVYEPWLDFGGKVGKGKSVSRPFIKGGRYLYPAIAEASPEIKTKVETLLSDLSEKYGL